MYTLSFVVFGFAQTTFTGSERGQDYQVQAGFLSGRPNTGLVLGITLVDGNAGIQMLFFKLLHSSQNDMQKEIWITGL